MNFEYEQARDQTPPEDLAAIAVELWDAGAHLVRCNSNPDDPRFKVPIGSAWQKERHPRAEIEAWVEQGNFIGIMAPAASLGISCVDIDQGVEFRAKAIESLGCDPLAAHESSRTTHHKCHFWYFTPEPVSAIKWAGGDIRSDSNHQVLLYNLPAVKAAWEWAKSGQAPAVNLRALDGIKTAAGGLLDGDLAIEKDDAGVPLPDDVAAADGAVAETDRHDTMIAKIARAVAQCTTKKELAERLRVITTAHRAAFTDEKDPARRGSVKAEIAGATAFAEGAWAKKAAARKIEARILATTATAVDRDAGLAALEPMIAEFETECAEHGWPTPERARPDLTATFEKGWARRENAAHVAAAFQDAQQAATVAHNEQIAATAAYGADFLYQVESDWGTMQSWIDAAEILGIKFRYNSFTERGDVFIPTVLLKPESGGGKWTQMTDNLSAVITVSIGKHVVAPAGKAGHRPVEVGPPKERAARNFLFTQNSWCPMRDYFESLPPWCGEMLIHQSMERGGMRVDAGEFTAPAQAFLWLFVVRNCLYPGSSMREHIVLHGERDCGKSKFVELALPHHLREYFNPGFSLAGSLKVKLERSIGKALLECGEMGQGGAKDWNAVKQWLTMSDVSGERMAYKEFAKRHRLTATTIFTTNHPELPPTDDAAISRFIWVNVLSKASRAVDEAGNEREIVWGHFEELYDPARPELGTWREQYFAQALAIVKGSVRHLSYTEAGEARTRIECNPQWLPPGSKNRLVEWNRAAGSTFATDQSTLIDDLVEAAHLVAAAYDRDLMTPGTFLPTMDLRAALYAIRDEIRFRTWADINEGSSDNVGQHDRLLANIRAAASDKAIANAMPEVGRRAGFFVKKDRIRLHGDKGAKIRGWVADGPRSNVAHP